MAKYDVTFSCGHKQTIELFGKETERAEKIKYFEKYGTCSACYEEAKTVGCEEVEMLYGDYKLDYSDCKTKKNSYDAQKKTITVYVPIAG